MGVNGLVFTVVIGAFVLACSLAFFTVGVIERHLMAVPRGTTRRNGI
jgi:hypothetical protein